MIHKYKRMILLQISALSLVFLCASCCPTCPPPAEPDLEANQQTFAEETLRILDSKGVKTFAVIPTQDPGLEDSKKTDAYYYKEKVEITLNRALRQEGALYRVIMLGKSAQEQKLRLERLDYNWSDLVDQDKAVKFGKELGAEAIVMIYDVESSRKGHFMSGTIRVISVEGSDVYFIDDFLKFKSEH